MTALIRDYLERARDGELPPDDPLTPRESEIVKLIAEGHSSKEIAVLLVISDKTVERHRANVLEKLGMRDRVDHTRYAIAAGSSSPDRLVATTGPKCWVRPISRDLRRRDALGRLTATHRKGRSAG